MEKLSSIDIFQSFKGILLLSRDCFSYKIPSDDVVTKVSVEQSCVAFVVSNDITVQIKVSVEQSCVAFVVSNDITVQIKVSVEQSCVAFVVSNDITV